MTPQRVLSGSALTRFTQGKARIEREFDILVAQHDTHGAVADDSVAKNHKAIVLASVQ